MRSAKILALPDKLGAALAVCLDEYGQGEERKQNLINDGYEPDEIQQIVNLVFPVIEPFLTTE